MAKSQTEAHLYIYMYTHTHTYTHIYIYIYIYVCIMYVCMYKTIFAISDFLSIQTKIYFFQCKILPSKYFCNNLMLHKQII